jgi:cell division protein FtsL
MKALTKDTKILLAIIAGVALTVTFVLVFTMQYGW